MGNLPRPTAPVLVSESESEVKVKVKFKGNKCAQFSSFLILQKKCGKKSDSSLKIRKNFTKDFHVKKNSHGNSLKIESISGGGWGTTFWFFKSLENWPSCSSR